MLYNAKNGTLEIGGTTMDYIRFGTGERILVMLPGLGDGLRSMKGTALPMAFMYRIFAKDFTVYAFSRKNMLPDKDQLILVYCRSGRRSKIAAEALVELGYTNIKEFGGIIDWPYEVE